MLMSEAFLAHLLSLSAGKRAVFLVLLFERMLPELRAFSLAEKLDFSIYQKARQEFWGWLKGDHSAISWLLLREDILDAIPDSEDVGSLEASFAMNAGLVAADIAGFIADRNDGYVIEATGYARDSLHAFAASETGAIVHDRAVEDYINAHALMKREERVEREDVTILKAMQDPPLSTDAYAMLQHRAETQYSMLDDSRES